MSAYLGFLDLWIKKKKKKKKLGNKNLKGSFIIRIEADIMVWILEENARESYSKLEGIEKKQVNWLSNEPNNL